MPQIDTNELKHHGIKGMKWGVRRYQNPDGSLTSVGRKRQARKDVRSEKVKNAVERAKKKVNKETAAKAVVKGTRIASKLMMVSATDDIFYGGAGKRVLKKAVKQTGRAVVTAYTMANGGYDIRWYDN